MCNEELSLWFVRSNNWTSQELIVFREWSQPFLLYLHSVERTDGFMLYYIRNANLKKKKKKLTFHKRSPRIAILLQYYIPAVENYNYCFSAAKNNIILDLLLHSWPLETLHLAYLYRWSVLCNCCNVTHSCSSQAKANIPHSRRRLHAPIWAAFLS